MSISYLGVPGPGQLELPLTYLLASCLPNLIPSSSYCQTQLPKSPFLSGYFQPSMALLCRQNKIQARWTDIEGFLPILLHLRFQARPSALTGTIPVPAEPDPSASFPASSSCSCHSSAQKLFPPLHGHLVYNYLLSYGSGHILSIRDTATNKRAWVPFLLKLIKKFILNYQIPSNL